MVSTTADPEATSPVSNYDEAQTTVPDMDKYIAGGTGGDNESGGSQKVVAKLLVSNSAAGSVIGKAGASIDQLQRSSKARIQLSRAGEFYPGTSDRVLMLSGPLHSVLTALYLILEKVSNDNSQRVTQGENANEQVKVALPRRLCGVVIGQKGSTVRNFMNDSGATIRVQSLNDLSREDSERIVTIYGTRDKVLRAAALVLNALSMDPKYSGYLETTLQLAQTQGLVGPVKTTVGKSPLFNARTTVTVAIPDEDVGAILGKGGQTLTRLQQAAKVKITVSDRKSMDPKTREREVTIVGTHPQVKHAEAMIAEKISQHRAQRTADEDEYVDEEHH